MKIVYCLDSINYLGGVQRVTAIKANALAQLPGNEVWVIVADNSGERLFQLSPAVHFENLAVNYYEDDWKSRWNVLKGILVKRRRHKKLLEKCLEQIHPDVVISVGQSEKNFLPRVKGDWVKVREFHFTRNYRRLKATDLFEKASAVAGDCIERLSLQKYDRIVVLTKEEKKLNWKDSSRVSVIPNPVESFGTEVSPLDSLRVIAVGRLTYEKNFASLIRAFAIVAVRCPGWRLDIFGEGNEREMLGKMISDLGLEGIVSLKGISRNIQEELLSSSVLALTSRFEGFGMVLTEAMASGLPVVSYACPCGPKDIIADGVNGFLVPEGDEQMLADRVCELIVNTILRKKMGAAALHKSQQYSLDRIIPMWMDLFKR